MITPWFLFLYLFQVSIWWLATWLITQHWMAKYGQPAQWRMFVLTGLLAGILVPLFPWPIAISEEVGFALPEIRIGVDVPYVEEGQADNIPIPWSTMWLMVYVAGLAWRLSLWTKAMAGLFRLYRQSEGFHHRGDSLRVVAGLEVPFQFAGHIFIPERLLARPDALEMAVAHEKAHKRLGHTWDLMIGQIIGMAFWFHPMPRLLVRQMQLIHEFQADGEVIARVDPDHYARFIGQYRFLQSTTHPAHALNHGPLKKRIMKLYHPSGPLSGFHRMVIGSMTGLLFSLSVLVHPGGAASLADHPASKRIRDVLPSPLQLFDLDNNRQPEVFLSGADTTPEFRTAQASHQLQAPPAPPAPPAPSTPTAPPVPPHPMQGPDQMPRFPGCEEISDALDREQCANQKFLQFVYTHLRYPEAAKEMGIAGTCVASFFVETDGRVSEITFRKQIGGGTDEAIRDIFRKMDEEGIRWIPAMKDGKPVRGEMTLPIRFKLSEE